MVFDNPESIWHRQCHIQGFFYGDTALNMGVRSEVEAIGNSKDIYYNHDFERII